MHLWWNFFGKKSFNVTAGQKRSNNIVLIIKTRYFYQQIDEEGNIDGDTLLATIPLPEMKLIVEQVLQICLPNISIHKIVYL